MTIETFYNPELGWFNSSKPDLSDLATPYLEAAIRYRLQRKKRKKEVQQGAQKLETITIPVPTS